SYNKTFNDHNFDAILGASYQKSTSRTSEMGVLPGSFGSSIIQTLNNGVISPTATRTSKSQWGLASYFTRVNYNYKEKYLLAASLRTDGSSRFGPDNKWGNFPSASIAWRATQEEFLKDNKIINELKLRLSYGVTGNFNIGDFDYLGTISDVNYSPNGVLTKGQAQTNFADEKLKWERNESYNIGLDLGFLNRRLNFVVDYFDKKTNDLLYNVGIPSITGFANSVVNVGDVRNRGIELEVNTRNLTGAFKWETAFNFSRTKNEVVSLGGVNESIFTHTRGMSWLLRVGEPMFSYYGYKTIGVLQDANDVATSAILPGSKPGHAKYADINKDGKITPDDRTILGNYQPKFFMGLVNDFSWKNFDMSIVMQASVGGKMYNLENLYYQGATVSGMRRSLVENQWWSQAEPGDGKSPATALSALPYLSNGDFYLEDASFLGLRNLNIGYTLPGNVAQRMRMRSCRLYVSANNLFILTKEGFHGYNPEGYTGGLINGIESVGLNNGSEPISRVFSFGLNVNF
ncbi:MAG TPA: SusC/RagA family TonB-linked outer membrane protein, partial [Sphingobacteriaceae bacterium]